jgi:hypothetical protein
MATCFHTGDAVGEERLQRETPPLTRWLATTRFGLRPAEGGLALVQDFLNTAGGHRTSQTCSATPPGLGRGRGKPPRRGRCTEASGQQHRR